MRDVPRVQHTERLEQQDGRLFARDRPMLDAARNDDELSRLDLTHFVSKLHPQQTGQDEEELVFGLVMMPDELALQLDQLHSLSVEFADDARSPVFRDVR